MKEQGRIEQLLYPRLGNGGDGDPEPDSQCPGLIGCTKYDPCPIEIPHAPGKTGSAKLAREVGRRVRARLKLEP